MKSVRTISISLKINRIQKGDVAKNVIYSDQLAIAFLVVFLFSVILHVVLFPVLYYKNCFDFVAKCDFVSFLSLHYYIPKRIWSELVLPLGLFISWLLPVCHLIELNVRVSVHFSKYSNIVRTINRVRSYFKLIHYFILYYI